MTAQVRSKDGQIRKASAAVDQQNDHWVWGVIFTFTALTGLFVATLFVVAIG
jgi:hypothetical protein